SGHGGNMYLPLGNIKSKMRTAGFTMIELLVVIAVIGVLAVAVLSSINPIEQINKGRDTRTRSDAAQLINAIDRYFAVHELYPWNDIAYNTILAGTATSNEQFDVAFPNGDNCLGDADAGDFCVVDGTNSTWIDGL